MGEVVFVTGGARCGKSRFAEQRATLAKEAVTYLATMLAGDNELAARIERHRERRPTDWRTVEEPLAIANALTETRERDTVVLDCLSLWVSNLLFASGEDVSNRETSQWEQFVDECVSAANEVIEAQRMRKGQLIVVTNEVGLGIVPVAALSRYYRDALGLVNQVFARASSEAYLLVSGLPVKLK